MNMRIILLPFFTYIASLALTFAQDNLPAANDAVVANTRAIEFFGMVVDQSGQPVVGAKVELVALGLEIASAAGGLKQKRDMVQLITANDGRFALRGKSGRSVIIKNISKEGFTFGESPEREFLFSVEDTALVTEHRADINNPVIFRLWRKASEIPQLTKRRIEINIPWNSSNVPVNLITGTYGAGLDSPDFVLTIVPPSNPIRLNGGDQWRVKFTASAGGFAAGDEFMLEAPSTGYNPVAEFVANQTAGHLETSIGPKKIFVRTRNGSLHARVMIYAVHSSAGAFVVLDSAVNTNGSRNLDDGS